MTKQEFMKLVEQGPVILDGACGTGLMKAGMPVDACTEEWALEHPEVVVAIQKEYMRVKDALDEVEATGYGIVMPAIEELTLEEPEIVKQGGRYGVRLRASAPSIHLMKSSTRKHSCIT